MATIRICSNIKLFDDILFIFDLKYWINWDWIRFRRIAQNEYALKMGQWHIYK